MDLTVSGHNMEVTPRLQDYVEKKTARLDRYMPNLSEVHIDLTQQNAKSALDRHVAQITVRDTWGTILRAEERSSDIFAAVDAVINKLNSQISRYRGKRKRNRRSTRDEFMDLEPVPIEEEFDDEDELTDIVRRKRFTVHPMSAEEAIDQMELLGHDFFVFFDSEEEAINVVYRRRDNNYGLLQPEFA